jgi:hypothetical protein
MVFHGFEIGGSLGQRKIGRGKLDGNTKQIPFPSCIRENIGLDGLLWDLTKAKTSEGVCP